MSFRDRSPLDGEPHLPGQFLKVPEDIMPHLSIVIPVYFNAENLPVTYAALSQTISEQTPPIDVEIIFVDDGSGDGSFNVLKELREKDDRIKIVRLSRNYGSQMAILAGMKMASGKCAACMSADLQEPPQFVFQMYREWEKGADVVIAARQGREDGWMTRVMSNAFYISFRALVSRSMPKHGYDLFLLDSQVIQAIQRQKMNNIGLIGQILQMGYQRRFIFYTRQERKIGHSRFTFSRKLKLALDNIVNFSYLPLRFISILGLCSAIFGFAFGFYTAVLRIFSSAPRGYSTTVILICFFSGLLLFSIGVLGEYIWRILDLVTQRPEFLIAETRGLSTDRPERLNNGVLSTRGETRVNRQT